MTEPLFSIITINFNNKEGLKKTIDSVFAQSFQDYEYIIIDGGSTDGSKELIELYAMKDDFKKHVTYWCSEPDDGIYNAMNKGISHAKGNFINMMNSGDCLKENTLSSLSNIATQHKNEILYGAVNFIEKGHFILTYGKSAENIKDGMIPHQSCFVPHSIYERYGSYDESLKIASDYDKFLCFYMNGEKFFYTSLIIADYDREGISSTQEELHIKEKIAVQKRYGVYIVPTRKQLLKQAMKKMIKKILEMLHL